MADRRGTLNGKVAVITASTDGIGLAIAKRLAHDGAKIVISSRNQNKVDKAVRLLKAETFYVCGIVCHVAKKEDRAQLMQLALAMYGGIDILVSNASAKLDSHNTLLENTEQEWDELFETNVKAAFMLCKEVVPHLENRGGGSIVFVSSIAAYSPNNIMPMYSVTKVTLLGLVKALLSSVSPKNIRVNCIAPGFIKTELSRFAWNNPEVLQSILPKIPLTRYGSPEECSGIVSFLCSNDASYITGETIVVGGGMDSRL